MSKQTATEWLFKKLWDEPKDKLTWYAILNQAEEMFEEQIIDACNQIEVIGLDHELPGKKYYNQNFNK
jgi:DNA-binding ferritin-like protein (Dps family)